MGVPGADVEAGEVHQGLEAGDGDPAGDRADALEDGEPPFAEFRGEGGQADIPERSRGARHPSRWAQTARLVCLQVRDPLQATRDNLGTMSAPARTQRL